MPYNLSGNVTTKKDLAEIMPVEIYDLFLGDQDHADSETIKLVGYINNIDFFDTDGNAATYTAWRIRRSAVSKTTDTEVDTISIEADNVTEAMAGYAASYDGLRGKRIVVRLIFRDLLSSSADAKIVFDGTIDTAQFEGNKCIISVTSQLGSLKMKTGRPFQLQCPWRYGYIECNYDYDLFLNQFFEDATGDVPNSWVASGGTFTQEEIPFPKFTHWGNHIGKLIGNTGHQVYQIVTSATTANKKYYASIWLRGATGAETIKLFCYDDVTGTQYATEYTLTTSWKKYTISKTFGAASTVRRVGVESTDNTQTIYMDHARLYQVFTADAGSDDINIIDADRTEADNYWQRGWVEFLSGDNILLTRMVASSDQSDTKVILDWTLPNTIAAGNEYIIRRGCDKSLLTCGNTFSNEANFGGFHTIPLDKDTE